MGVLILLPPGLKQVRADETLQQPALDRLSVTELTISPDYRQSIAAILEQHHEFPENARRYGYEGTTLLRVRIKRDGSVIHAFVERTSGYPPFDKAALNAIARAAPFPPFPKSIIGPDEEFLIPIVFRLTRRTNKKGP